MSQIAAIVNCFQTRSDLTVTRVKDRFFEAPSAGGWRDIMINFYLSLVNLRNNLYLIILFY